MSNGGKPSTTHMFSMSMNWKEHFWKLNVPNKAKNALILEQ